MVNKCRVHGEIRDFRNIFWNLTKSDILMIKLNKVTILNYKLMIHEENT